MSNTYAPAGTDRPRNARPEVKAEPVPVPSPRVAEERAIRRRRIDDGPGRSRKLHVPDSVKEPGYVYRWVNDEPGRLHAKTVEDDWDYVDSKPIANGSAEGADKNSGLGTRIERIVGQTDGGQPLKAFLMRKPAEFHDQDKKREQHDIDERVAGIKRGQAPTQAGDNGSYAYVPTGGIKLDEGRS